MDAMQSMPPFSSHVECMHFTVAVHCIVDVWTKCEWHHRKVPDCVNSRFNDYIPLSGPPSASARLPHAVNPLYIWLSCRRDDTNPVKDTEACRSAKWYMVGWVFCTIEGILWYIALQWDGTTCEAI